MFLNSAWEVPGASGIARQGRPPGGEQGESEGVRDGAVMVYGN